MSKSRQKPRQKTRTVAKLFEGRLRIELRNGNPNYYARTFLQGKLVGKSTGETTLGAAKQVAGKWYRGLLGRVAAGESLYGRTFDQLVEPFLKHHETVQEVSALQRRNYRHKWSVLEPFLTGVRLTDIDLPWLEQLRDKRLADSVANESSLTPTTIKKDLLFIRKVLRYAVERERCLDALPVFPSFAGRKWKILPNPRPFFTHAQYKLLTQTAAKRMRDPAVTERVRAERRELYRFILICVGGCLRVDEARSLRFGDCEATTLTLNGKSERVLLMQVLGKHSPDGTAREDAFGLYGAVSAFKDLCKERPHQESTAPLFLSHHRDGFRELLTACRLRDTDDGKKRDLKSLRPTGISLRLDLGPKNPDYRAIAKFARTSPDMIAKFYDQTHPESLLGQVVGMRRDSQPGRSTERTP